MIETITVEIKWLKQEPHSMPDCKLYLLEIGYLPEKNQIQYP